MDNETKRKPCIKKNSMFTKEFTVGKRNVKIEQRKLSMGEVNHLGNIKEDVLDDYEVYESMIKHDEIINNNKLLKERICAKYKKELKKIDGYDDYMNPEHEDYEKPNDDMAEIINNMNIELGEKLQKIDPKTLFLIESSVKKLNKTTNIIKTKTIAFSVTNDDVYGGYFTVDDEVLEGEKLIKFLDKLEPSVYKELYLNTILTQHPTNEEIEDAK